jgi:hypothetical protein
MITVFLRGGLGNQMFQYALGLNLAKKNETELVLDTTFLNDRFPRREFTYRSYALDAFALEPRFTVLSRISSALPVPGLWLGLDLALMQAQSMFGGCVILKEENESVFDPAVLTARGNIVLWGYWQSEKYFRDVGREIKEAFKFRSKLTGEAARLAEEIWKTESVSIHIRRGDYAAIESVEKLHGKTDLDYYARAVAYISARLKNPRFFVFSDDISWCRQNLKTRFSTTFVAESLGGPNGSLHLRLMSFCKNNIIANSTFSWWAAWLNENPDKIVIAPARWYADGRRTDIVPERWIKI